VGQTIELQISSLSSLGEGVARLDDENEFDGLVVLVPFVIPGERVLARVYRVTSSFASADLVSVVTPSSVRIEPRCELFGRCGGCQYQHMPLRTQRECKRQHVIDALERIGGYTDRPADAQHPLLCTELETLVRTTAGADLEYGYRSKVCAHSRAQRVHPRIRART
jgi:23S rRNA (uracil1939-C5)-methyltransferase/tRNA (uracil-5-)-methyltransferase